MTDSTPAPVAPDRFEFDGETFAFLSEDDLLFAEAHAIEKHTGVAFEELGKSGNGLAAMQALVWVSIKRRRPTFRYADLDAVPIATVRFLAPEAPEGEPQAPVDPTPPAAPGSGSAAAAG